MVSTPSSSIEQAAKATRHQPSPPLASAIVATMYTTAANAESRYASGASWNFVPIWTPARDVAASAKIAYTATSTRPGPVAVLRCRSTPHLVQSQHHHRDGQAGD